jgi:hypothetical protein
MKNKTIAIDIDGVLRNIVAPVRKYFDIDFENDITLNLYKSIPDPLLEYNFHAVVGMDIEKFLNWMYVDRVFQIFAMAPRTYPTVIDDLNIFAKTAEAQGYNVWISSVQHQQALTATLFWLSKFGCKVQRYHFFNDQKEKRTHGFDIAIDDSPEILKHIKNRTNKQAIRFLQPYNEQFDGIDTITKIDDLYELLGIARILKVK